MILLAPAHVPDCRHHRYPTTCPECTGVKVEGSRFAFALLVVFLVLEFAVGGARALDIDGAQTDRVTRAIVAGLDAATRVVMAEPGAPWR